MNTLNADIFIAMMTAVACAALVIIGLVKDTFQARKRWLLFYLAATGGWMLILAVAVWPALPAGWHRPLERLTLYGLLGLSLPFGVLSQSFLRSETRPRRWLIWGGAWGGSLLLLDVVSVWGGGAAAWGWRSIPGALLWGGLLGWAGVMGVTAVATIRAYRQTARRPLHRNRIRYWLLVQALLTLGDLAIFRHNFTVGLTLRLLTTLLIAYAMLMYRLLDVRQIMQQVISYSVAALLVGLLYLAAFVGTSVQFDGRLPFHPLLYIVALAMLTALLLNPLRQLVQTGLERLSADIEYDPNRMLREYSLTISQIVDLVQLEATAVMLISQAMEISYGTLYLVDEDSDDIGRTLYQLSSVQGFGGERLVLGTFAASSPVAAYLAQEHRPLLQYDIDLLPQFQDVRAGEREWLLGLGVDVYVPIYSQDKWIGLLGLGPKMSGNRYFDNDLLLLSTLADQTAVALENARLVADLVRLNQDLKQAYADLENANRQLKESDKLKSAFISMITHELRTPFANIGFSLQLLRRYGVQNLSSEQQEELAQLDKGVAQAKGMVDNLVTFASFLSKQGELRPSRFDFGELVHDTLRPLRPLAQNKNVNLHLESPDDPIKLRGDRERLADAIHHLVHNAIKFTPTGGAVRVQASGNRSRVRFLVQDTGVGIPDERLPDLWHGFTQMADPVQRGLEGMGLGLPLVKYIIQAHQGKVFVQSEEAVGSTFGFTLETNNLSQKRTRSERETAVSLPSS